MWMHFRKIQSVLCEMWWNSGMQTGKHLNRKTPCDFYPCFYSEVLFCICHHTNQKYFQWWTLIYESWSADLRLSHSGLQYISLLMNMNARLTSKPKLSVEAGFPVSDNSMSTVFLSSVKHGALNDWRAPVGPRTQVERAYRKPCIMTGEGTAFTSQYQK